MGIDLTHVLILLAITVAIILGFQRMHVPTSLAYLLVGLVLGPHTPGVVMEPGPIQAVAEFGIVFLLFTIGLNFSLPQIHALRHQVLGLGTGQVALTTAVVGLLAWLIGLPAAAAFVVGAVFAQSSTTIISKQLADQGEDASRHGRLGTAMSVFQDVTAVPFVVIIPVLGTAAGAAQLGGALGWALLKAALALLLVFFAGRWLLRPLFHLVSRNRSAEVFTLAVLLVALAAGAITHGLGLSMAFGAFLAGMVLGETEFRHQVESTIRPFRDVLLGLFFIGIGMLFDPAALPQIWHLALLGALALLLLKVLVVVAIVRASGIETATAWRTALILAVGGEFGFALLALALQGGVIGQEAGQVVLSSVLFSMVLAPFLIRYNGPLARWLSGRQIAPDLKDLPRPDSSACAGLDGHVIVCGYGRIGQSVGNFLEAERIAYVALDLDPSRVREAHRAGEPVFYGDASENGVLELVGLARARLLVISSEDTGAALRILEYVRRHQPGLRVMVRPRDESQVDALRAAGASEVVPETLEAGLMIATQVLRVLGVPAPRVAQLMDEQRSAKYRLLRELFPGDALATGRELDDAARLRSVRVEAGSAVVGRSLAELAAEGGQLAGEIAVIVREGRRLLNPPQDLRLAAGDTVVVFGSPEQCARAREALGA